MSWPWETGPARDHESSTVSKLVTRRPKMKKGIIMQKAISLVVNGRTLRGMHHIPKENGRFPTVIMYHGFMSSKLESRGIFVKLSRLLASRGFAAVRFDFSGSGESDGNFRDMTFSREVDEALAILRFVESLPHTNPERIGIVGSSMGGAIASIVAGKNADIVKALTLWAAPSIDIVAGLESRLKDEMRFPRNQRGDIDMGGLWLNHGFFEDLKNWDVFGSLRKYKGPAFLAYGTGDQLVPPATAINYEKALPGPSILHYLEEADHGFNRCDWSDEVIKETVAFFSSELIK